MKVIISVIFLVFVMVIGLSEIEKNRATFYSKLSSNQAISESIYENSTIVKVTLTGCVNNPGTYSIYAGQTLEDAILKAGGETMEADSYCYDSYLVIEEDIAIYIAKETDDEKISINEADSKELQSLTGIGQTIADRIVEYRDENGDFAYLEQLMNVSGIGTSLFNKIKNKICL